MRIILILAALFVLAGCETYTVGGTVRPASNVSVSVGVHSGYYNPYYYQRHPVIIHRHYHPRPRVIVPRHRHVPPKKRHDRRYDDRRYDRRHDRRYDRHPRRDHYRDDRRRRH